MTLYQEAPFYFIPSVQIVEIDVLVEALLFHGYVVDQDNSVRLDDGCKVVIESDGSLSLVERDGWVWGGQSLSQIEISGLEETYNRHLFL